jgi:hypothetical protein
LHQVTKGIIIEFVFVKLDTGKAEWTGIDTNKGIQPVTGEGVKGTKIFSRESQPG